MRKKLKHICANEYVQDNRQVQPDYCEANKEKIYDDGYIQSSTCIDEVRQSVFRSFKWSLKMLLAVLITWGITKQYGIIINTNLMGILKIAGPLIVLCSTQGKAGSTIQTLGGKSIPETINSIWARWLYMIGVYIALTAQVI